ncbi:MAG: hypothetical protein Q4A15_02175 [Prevotellaceae bacterium]|nr:hypothetical protein [Prevotellaceae bacterium]
MTNAKMITAVNCFLAQSIVAPLDRTDISKIYLKKSLSHLAGISVKTYVKVPVGYYLFGAITLVLSCSAFLFALMDFALGLTKISAVVYISIILSGLALFFTDLTAIKELKKSGKK